MRNAECGIRNGGVAPPVPRYHGYMMTVRVQGGLDISPVMTHRLPCADFQEGFDVINHGDCGKVVLSWEDEA